MKKYTLYVSKGKSFLISKGSLCALELYLFYLHTWSLLPEFLFRFILQSLSTKKNSLEYKSFFSIVSSVYQRTRTSGKQMQHHQYHLYTSSCYGHLTWTHSATLFIFFDDGNNKTVILLTGMGFLKIQNVPKLLVYVYWNQLGARSIFGSGNLISSL